MKDKEIIQKHGGTSALAHKLGFDKKNGPQRVNNWVKRGIPPAIKIKYPEIFLVDALVSKKKKPNASSAPSKDS